MHRRDFLAAALFGPRAASRAWSTPLPGLALIGAGKWGLATLRETLPGCRVVALCDVDERRLRQAAGLVAAWAGQRPRLYTDHRAMLASETPRVVLIATPEHWRAAIAINALRSGAAVLVDWAAGVTLEETRELEKTGGNVIAIGARYVHPGLDFLRAGHIGRIDYARAYLHRPQDPTIWHSGECGTPWFAQVLAWREQAPRSVHSIGWRHTGAKTQTAAFDYDGFTLEWEFRTYVSSRPRAASSGLLFHGAEGVLHLRSEASSESWSFHPRDPRRPAIAGSGPGQTPLTQATLRRAARFTLAAMASLRSGQAVEYAKFDAT